MARRPSPPLPSSVRALVLSVGLLSSIAAASEKKAEEPAEKKGEDAAAAAESLEISEHYVHRWLPMPSFTADGVGADAGPMAVAPRPGRVLVVLFLASYCEPCQLLM